MQSPNNADASVNINTHRKQPPARDLQFFAVLVGCLSIILLFRKLTSDGFVDSWTASLSKDPILSILAIACAGGGILAAKRIWNAHRLSFVTYTIWAILYMAAFLIGDARKEPDVWKLLAGSVPAWIVTVSGAIFVHRRVASPSIQSGQ